MLPAIESWGAAAATGSMSAAQAFEIIITTSRVMGGMIAIAECALQQPSCQR
jgi:hypothetical protein